ncbi:helix-turn-helix transcriptional regulator [Tenacibaculum pacificus]|uniref:helix-turn-helix domain-containing protein n=1 Tax=Tenacibaculum pacificus TaxID=3018314 RepID=UPI0022F3C58A|nr:helix-turn-helix transcriptional regulator [Tenacibaculum pacificus]WBX74630.1 helix-turn-helix transcriptional regulator [Tenacibaculum pacificus]
MEILTRLKKILSHYNLTSSTFADTIDVQRSSISHLLSGRNKPSLDFIMKTVNKFPEVDLYWFLYGEGVFPKEEKKKEIIAEVVIESEKIESKEVNINKKESPTLLSDIEVSTDKTVETKIKNSKKLVKIVLLYNDGSFNEFNQ